MTSATQCWKQNCCCLTKVRVQGLASCPDRASGAPVVWGKPTFAKALRKRPVKRALGPSRLLSLRQSPGEAWVETPALRVWLGTQRSVDTVVGTAFMLFEVPTMPQAHNSRQSVASVQRQRPSSSTCNNNKLQVAIRPLSGDSFARCKWASRIELVSV